MTLSEKNRKRLWLIYAAILFFWAVNAYIMLGQWLCDNQLFAVQIDNKPYVADFVNHYGAGILARRCLSEPVAIYDRQVQEELQRKLMAPVVPEQLFYLQYPPTIFLFCLPFSLLAMAAAWIVWVIAGSLATVGAYWLSILPLFDNRFAKTFVLIAIFASYPMWLSIRLGQTSLLLLPALILVFHCLWIRKFVLAGVLTSILSVKLQYLPGAFAAGLAAGGIPYLLGFGVSGLILLGLCTTVVGWPNICAFPAAILTNESTAQVAGVAPDAMQNLRGMLFLILHSDTQLVHRIVTVFWLLVAIYIFILWRKHMRGETLSLERFNLLAALTMILMLFSSPHTHTQDYVVAVAAGTLIWAAMVKDAKSNRENAMLQWLTLSFPLLSWVFFVFMFLFHMIGLQPFAIWAIFVGAAVQRRLLLKTADEPVS